MGSKKGMDDQDRISNLPDGVLCHILSFLPTKYSIRTRVLSTRWNLLFSFVPFLDFQYSSYRDRNSTSFINCVDSVFTLYSLPHMNKFRLQFWGGEEPLDHFPIDSWISSASNHHVQQVDFEIDLGIPLTLPRHLFSCKTLTDLKLRGTYSSLLNLALPDSVCLPCLRTCYLEKISLDDQSARMLFRSCSSLEQLELASCRVGQGGELLDISSQTLKHLSIREPKKMYKIVLNLPNLLKFRFSCFKPTENEFLGLESLTSLVDAWILYQPETYTIIQDIVVLELIRAWSHVRKLYLSSETMEAFLRRGQQLPTLNNLTSLSFSPISSIASRLLPELLDSSPRLENLSFYQGDEEECFGNQESYLLPEHVPSCVAEHLKEVEFRYFFGLDYDLKLIKYFLKYAKNLKRMKICSKSSWNEQFEIASASCEDWKTVTFVHLCPLNRWCSNFQSFQLSM